MKALTGDDKPQYKPPQGEPQYKPEEGKERNLWEEYCGSFRARRLKLRTGTKLALKSGKSVNAHKTHSSTVAQKC